MFLYIYLILTTLYNAFRIIDNASPAEMSESDAPVQVNQHQMFFTLSDVYKHVNKIYLRYTYISKPSFCICLTLEFINTVQRDPKSTGRDALNPNEANCATVMPSDSAKCSRKDPQPDEHA
jgi:hypothetical protein